MGRARRRVRFPASPHASRTMAMSSNGVKRDGPAPPADPFDGRVYDPDDAPPPRPVDPAELAKMQATLAALAAEEDDDARSVVPAPQPLAPAAGGVVTSAGSDAAAVHLPPVAVPVPRDHKTTELERVRLGPEQPGRRAVTARLAAPAPRHEPGGEDVAAVAPPERAGRMRVAVGAALLALLVFFLVAVVTRHPSAPTMASAIATQSIAPTTTLQVVPSTTAAPDLAVETTSASPVVAPTAGASTKPRPSSAPKSSPSLQPSPSSQPTTPTPTQVPSALPKAVD